MPDPAMTSQPLDCRSTDGLRLEAVLDAPERVHAAVVVCHPHPRLGGTMNAPLLQTLRDELVSRAYAVLRFNFRGIGVSEGESALGEDEVADAAGALDRARLAFPAVATALVGWSFGGAVAIRAAARDPAVAACVAIAPSVRPKPGITAGLPPPDGIELRVPLLMVAAANDDQVDPAAIREWAEQVPTARAVEMRGANHFFWAKYDDLSNLVADFLDEHTRMEARADR